MEKKRFYRTKYNAKFGGVCNGLAEYFDCDVSKVRVIFALLGLFMGNGVLFYFILWFVLPEKRYIDEVM